MPSEIALGLLMLARPAKRQGMCQETPLMVAAQRGSVAHCQILLQDSIGSPHVLPSELGLFVDREPCHPEFRRMHCV